ncbi:MAG TPA: glucuronate isomerase, partial [Rhabdaerophilum sp.]|nr:glucuronate isomerase [Rhabdaerophilum sp.]
MLHPDRLFPADPTTRDIARRLYARVKDLPIISPHGHTDPRWYAENEPFANPASLFVIPDHYIFRMLYSQGIALEKLGISRLDGGPVENDPRKIWRLFAANYHLFRATPTRMWLDHAFETLFGLTDRLNANNADHFYDVIDAALKTEAFRPRALFERMKIEVISTTDGALDDLRWHRMIRDSGWKGRVVPAYRPDAVVDPEFRGFRENIAELGRVSGCDTGIWEGYLAAHRQRRAYFKTFGCTSSDHGHP